MADTSCSHGEVKLVGGSSSNEGYVQYCNDGVWSYACGHYYSYAWDLEEVNVMCYQLGYNTSSCEYIMLKK